MATSINRQMLLETLEELPVNDENATLLFKWIFTEDPKLREYFVGDEKITPEQVLSSPRFKKVGKRYIRKIHTLVYVSGSHKEFRKHCADLIERHKKNYRVQSVAEKFQGFGVNFVNFLHARLSLDADEVAAWTAFWKFFVKEIKKIEHGPKTKTLTDWHGPTF